MFEKREMEKRGKLPALLFRLFISDKNSIEKKTVFSINFRRNFGQKKNKF